MPASEHRDAKAQQKANKAYVKATRPWYKKKRFWLLGLLALLILISLLSNMGGDKPTPGTSSSSQPNQGASSPTAAEKPIVVTSKKMGEDLKANALKASETYKGKRVQVTGPVSNIDASGAYFSLTGGEYEIAWVRIDIDESQKSIVSGLSQGQEVTVTGEVTGVGEVIGYAVKAESIK